jgi:hypothetical protein
MPGNSLCFTLLPGFRRLHAASLAPDADNRLGFLRKLADSFAVRFHHAPVYRQLNSNVFAQGFRHKA